VTSVLNFAPVVLDVPAGVDVRKVDLSIELQILAFHAQRRAVFQVARSAEWQERQARRRSGREADAPGELPSVKGDPGVEAQAVAR
jgi:redox-sensing transcriptional repressor